MPSKDTTRNASKRVKLTAEPIPDRNNYFVSDKPGIQFVSSGCAILDCILGGGYPLGRMVNIIGDKSTAKTHLACEAIANFATKYPKGMARYRDVEAAFDVSYAASMGIPVDKVDFGDPDKPLDTVENFFTELHEFVNDCSKRDVPGIYVLDSLDALSSEAEMNRAIGDSSYGMEKQKKLGELFRKEARLIERSKVLLIIVSQIRDNIGVTFGERHRRSGGKALDFYASQFLYLTHIGQITRTIKKVKRVVGVDIKASIRKNKVGLPFRSCEFPFIFGYGVDDVEANTRYLTEVDRLNELEITAGAVKEYLKEVRELSDDEFEIERANIASAVKRAFVEIETTFLPVRKKYVRSDG